MRRGLEGSLMHSEMGSLSDCTWWPHCICAMLGQGNLWDHCLPGCSRGTSGQAEVATGRHKHWQSAHSWSVSCWGPLGTTESRPREARSKHVRGGQMRWGQPPDIEGQLPKLKPALLTQVRAELRHPGSGYAQPRGDSLPSLPNMPTPSCSSFEANLESLLLF